tara:strand:+ start:895 stop:1797 length:903 start_codon:yes stop_codon:yes gene_type:complete
MTSTKGVLLFARNNNKIDYVKQAYYLAKRVKNFLNLPITVVTDSPSYLRQNYSDADNVFDNIISVVWSADKIKDNTVLSKYEKHDYKSYNDGTLSRVKLQFKNQLRSTAYNISPYDETLLLDTDIVLCNNYYLNCFNQNNDFLIYHNALDIAGFRDYSEFEYVNDIGVKFYWATAVFFRKTPENKIFFDLLEHIQENWNHYKSIFQINQTYFRNDYAFSIAIHIMNGYTEGDFAQPMPGKLFYTTDKDICWQIKNDKITFLLEKENYTGEYTLSSWKGTTVHVMNKFSLNRCIDEDIKNV